MLKALYDWTMRRAASERAPVALGGVAFAESSFFPIPPDVMLIPMVIARPKQAWWYATITTVASVVGGLFGYAIGYYLYQSVGLPILQFYGKESALDTFNAFVHDYGALGVFIAGMTPIPYKVATIAAGVAKMDVFAFVAASILARATRFYLVAGLLYFFGETIREFIEKRLTLVTTVFVVLLVGGFIALKFIF